MNRFIAICSLLVLIACDKVSAFELESNEERFDRQAAMLKIIDSRTQVSDFTLHTDFFSVSFTSGEVFKFSLEGTPVFNIAENGEWFVNGTKTDVKAQFEGALAAIPEIRISETGKWIIGGEETAIMAHTELTAEDLEMSYISHIVYANDWLHVFLFNGEPLRVPVVSDPFYQVPSYFQDILVKKELKAEEFIQNSDGDFDAFIFFTDAHWGYNYKHSPALIRHITEYTSIKKTFFGGDVITNYFGNLVAPMQLGQEFQSSFSFLGPHFYCVYGNHDNNSAGQPSKNDRHLSEGQVASWLQSQMTVLDKKEGYNFYFDNISSRTRYIGLDTGRYHNASFRSTSPETAQFLISALSSVPDDWHIIVISHIWANYKVVDNIETSVFVPYYNSFLNIITNYNERKNGEYTYKDQTVAYDFTMSRATVECCIGGHTHLNSVLSYKEKLPVIIVGKDSMKRDFHKDHEGTYKEQCVAILIMDYKHREIKLLFVGYGEDQTIVIPYSA